MINEGKSNAFRNIEFRSPNKVKLFENNHPEGGPKKVLKIIDALTTWFGTTGPQAIFHLYVQTSHGHTRSPTWNIKWDAMHPEEILSPDLKDRREEDRRKVIEMMYQELFKGDAMYFEQLFSPDPQHRLQLPWSGHPGGRPKKLFEIIYQQLGSEEPDGRAFSGPNLK